MSHTKYVAVRPPLVMNVRGLPLLAFAVSLHYLPRYMRSAVTVHNMAKRLLPELEVSL